ncbi:MAG: nucleotidyltransferase domain-containing protein [Chloroflexi bacterium]|nr:nucleotidyltransferase domain-containing protein [Chloroflexi bacterium CFX2]MCQ3938540.1 nucleotidyltransferase domain-containing protein [Chloroflexota bacterium]MDL1944620.1 nucleotidyltransferase domain-containing protein [Chloroflexi bacterium CFX2]
MPARKTSTSQKRKVSEARPRYQTRGLRRTSSRRDTILVKCKRILTQMYGWRMKGIILYGSSARRQASPSSDIDLLVLLVPPVDYLVELRRLVDALYPIQLESDRLISAKPASVKDFEAGKISLYRNAKREGIAV